MCYGAEAHGRLRDDRRHGSENEQTLAWLLSNCAHFVTVNSTTLYQAMALGKPTSCLGRGWFTSNGVTAECTTIRDALVVPTPDAARV